MASSRPIGAGALVCESGAKQVDNFSETVYRAVSQDISYTRKEKLSFVTNGVIIQEACSTTFTLTG